jgi:hypothetical protein
MARRHGGASPDARGDLTAAGRMLPAMTKHTLRSWKPATPRTSKATTAQRIVSVGEIKGHRVANPAPSTSNGDLVIHGQPGHWSRSRHLRVFDWGDPYCIVAVHVTRRAFGSPDTGFALVGPFDLTGTIHLAAFAPPLKEEVR